MRVGVISDTHGLLRDEAIDRLTGVDHVIHAGDIGDVQIIEDLRRIAPTTAIRGNNDTAEWASHYPSEGRIELAGRMLYVLHDLKKLSVDPAEMGYDVVISGHSHKPKIEEVDGVLYLNPGSAGASRFSLPITIATLDLSDSSLYPAIHDLAV